MLVRTFNQVSYDDIYISKRVFTSHTLVSYTDGGLAITWKRANFMFLSCALLLGYCHYMNYSVYTEREREKERETTLFKHTPLLGRVCRSPKYQHRNCVLTKQSSNMCVFFTRVSSFCLYMGFGMPIPFDINVCVLWF